MKKGTALPIVLILLGLAVAAIFFYKISKPQNNLITPEFSQEENQKQTRTYSNKTHNFELEYPKDWELREFQDFAADFSGKIDLPQETMPLSIIVRFSSSGDSFDKRGFDKIYKIDPGETYLEILDVRSTVTKVENIKIGNSPAIKYKVDRKFSALEGPTEEFRQVVEINRNETILRFLITADTKGALEIQNEEFEKIISSINFKK